MIDNSQPTPEKTADWSDQLQKLLSAYAYTVDQYRNNCMGYHTFPVTNNMERQADVTKMIESIQLDSFTLMKRINWLRKYLASSDGASHQ